MYCDNFKNKPQEWSHTTAMWKTKNQQRCMKFVFEQFLKYTDRYINIVLFKHELIYLNTYLIISNSEIQQIFFHDCTVFHSYAVYLNNSAVWQSHKNFTCVHNAGEMVDLMTWCKSSLKLKEMLWSVCCYYSTLNLFLVTPSFSINCRTISPGRTNTHT